MTMDVLVSTSLHFIYNCHVVIVPNANGLVWVCIWVLGFSIMKAFGVPAGSLEFFFSPDCGQVIVLLSLFVYCDYGDIIASHVHRMQGTYISNDQSFANGDRIMLVSIFKWFKVGL